jgi:hypothetical protein
LHRISYVISHVISSVMLIFDHIPVAQDCVCLIAPFPFNIQAVEEFDPSADFDVTGEGNVWYALPQLFFSCTVCRRDHQENRSSHQELSLVFFSTFEPINLSPDNVMQGMKEVPMLYERSERQLPTLYVCPVENVLGRVPLIPCYMAGNTHPTIPYCFRGKNLGGAAADSRKDNGTESKLFEVNIWMWRYGRGRSRMVSIAEAERIRSEHVSESRLRAAETRKRRSEAAAAAEAAQGGGGAD